MSSQHWNCSTVVTVVGNFVALSFIEPTFLPLCGNTCAVEHNHADSEERDLVNILPSLSLKPSNLPARDAPWKWVTSPFKMLHMCILSWFQQLMLWFELELIYCLVLEVDQKNVAWEYVWFVCFQLKSSCGIAFASYVDVLNALFCHGCCFTYLHISS